jgi:hypothetical protein
MTTSDAQAAADVEFQKKRQNYCECGRLRTECTGGFAKNRNTLHSDKTGAEKTSAIFMNEYDIDDAMQTLNDDPVLGKAVRFLRDFRDEVNSHSDGWAYWRAPVAAAGQLMTLIKTGMDIRRGRGGIDPQQITDQMVAKAMGPIKSFMTRKGLAAGMQMPKLAFTPEKPDTQHLPTPARPCSASDMTFGGKCLNCGGVNRHAPQPKRSADIGGDVSEAKSEVDYNKADTAGEPKATDTVNPDHFAAIDDEGHAVEKPTKSYTDVGKDNREAVGKFACGESQPESVEFDFGAGDLADIVLVEDEEEK